MEGNVPRRSLGGNTTPSGGLLICSIGAKVSAMGGRGMTAGDMVCEFVVIKSFWNRRIWEDKMEFSVTLPYISTNPRSLMCCWGRPHTTRTTTTTKKKLLPTMSVGPSTPEVPEVLALTSVYSSFLLTLVRCYNHCSSSPHVLPVGRSC